MMYGISNCFFLYWRPIAIGNSQCSVLTFRRAPPDGRLASFALLNSRRETDSPRGELHSRDLAFRDTRLYEQNLFPSPSPPHGHSFMDVSLACLPYPIAFTPACRSGKFAPYGHGYFYVWFQDSAASSRGWLYPTSTPPPGSIDVVPHRRWDWQQTWG